MKPLRENFYRRTRDAKKIMVFVPGGLGGAVRLLPSLNTIRSAYPGAALHVMVASHVVSLMECVPWVDRVWSYRRSPGHAALKENPGIVMRMRRERFDVTIDLGGSEHSDWLTFFSGAKERLGCEPGGDGSWLWKRLFTETVRRPSAGRPAFERRCRCLEAAGLPPAVPEFDVTIPPEAVDAPGIPPEEIGNYFHIGPFARSAGKELSPQDMVRLIVALEERFPDRRIALSCSAEPQELAKMYALLNALPRRPRWVFAGDLSLPELAGLIRHSAIHLSGDTGAFHLAVMIGTPAVAWFRPDPESRDRVPCGGPYHVVSGTHEPGSPFVQGVEIETVLSRIEDLLGKRCG